jgi:hypothetical protein
MVTVTFRYIRGKVTVTMAMVHPEQPKRHDHRWLYAALAGC